MITKLEQLQIKNNKYGWAVDFESFQHVLSLGEKQAKNLWQFCCGNEEEFVLMDLLIGFVLFSCSTMKNKLNFLFSAYRTKFEKALTQAQIELLFDAVVRSLILFMEESSDFDNFMESLMAQIFKAKTSIDKHFRTNQIEHYYFMEWAMSEPAVLGVLTIYGTKDAKHFQAQMKSPIEKKTIPTSSVSIVNRKKKKTLFLPTNRQDIQAVIRHMEVFVPESYKIQRSYRQAPLFKPTHIIELKRNFEIMDVDKSNSLTISEFCNGFPNIKMTVKRIFAKAAGNDEQMNFDEFLNVLYPDTFDEEREMMNALVKPPPEPTRLTLMDLSDLFKHIDKLDKKKRYHVKLSEIVAVMARTHQLYYLVIKWSRFERSRWDYYVTFEELLARLFPNYNCKEIRDMSIWCNNPPIKNLSEEQVLDIELLFTKWDANCDSCIDFDELTEMLRNQSIDIDIELIKSIFRHMDADWSDDISFDELKKFFEYAWLFCEREMDAHFSRCNSQKRNSDYGLHFSFDSLM